MRPCQVHLVPGAGTRCDRGPPPMWSSLGYCVFARPPLATSIEPNTSTSVAATFPSTQDSSPGVSNVVCTVYLQYLSDLGATQAASHVPLLFPFQYTRGPGGLVLCWQLFSGLEHANRDPCSVTEDVGGIQTLAGQSCLHLFVPASGTTSRWGVLAFGGEHPYRGRYESCKVFSSACFPSGG